MDTKTKTQTHFRIQAEKQTTNTATTIINNHHTKNMKLSSSSNSDSYTHLESPNRFYSPGRFNSPPESPPYASPDASPQKSSRNLPEKQNSKAIVAVADSPAPEKAAAGVKVNGAVRGDGAPSMTKAGPGGEPASIPKKPRTEETMKVSNLGFRLSEVVLCLISFTVMAANKSRGWAGDSFDRYREYRYCLCINVIGFAYSAFQAYDLSYYIGTGKHVIRHHLRRPFDFFIDQILAYLLISAASAAATRVYDWQSNWGKDEFTVMASASVAMACLAFVAFAFSSLISGYNLCTTEAM